MKRAFVIPLACIAAGVLFAVLAPFSAFDASWRPGLAELVNGGTGLGLMVIGAIWLTIIARRENVK